MFLVIDNTPIYYNRLDDICYIAGIKLIKLLLYLLEFNPIELLFSLLKL